MLSRWRSNARLLVVAHATLLLLTIAAYRLNDFISHRDAAIAYIINAFCIHHSALLGSDWHRMAVVAVVAAAATTAIVGSSSPPYLSPQSSYINLAHDRFDALIDSDVQQWERGGKMEARHLVAAIADDNQSNSLLLAEKQYLALICVLENTNNNGVRIFVPKSSVLETKVHGRMLPNIYQLKRIVASSPFSPTCFILNVGDYPFSLLDQNLASSCRPRINNEEDAGIFERQRRRLRVPTFSYARKHSCHSDFLIPYNELLQRSLMPSIAEHCTAEVEKKRKFIVFRGWRARHRAAILDSLMNSSAYVDYSHQYMSPEEQCKSRALLDIDGNTYSRRLAWYVRSNSIIVRGGTYDDVLSRLVDNFAYKFDLFNASSAVHMVRRAVANDNDEERARRRDALRTQAALAEDILRPGIRIWDAYVLLLINRYAEQVFVNVSDVLRVAEESPGVIDVTDSRRFFAAIFRQTRQEEEKNRSLLLWLLVYVADANFLPEFVFDCLLHSFMLSFYNIASRSVYFVSQLNVGVSGLLIPLFVIFVIYYSKEDRKRIEEANKDN